MVNMKESSYKSYDDLPLFLNAETVAKVRTPGLNDTLTVGGPTP